MNSRRRVNSTVRRFTVSRSQTRLVRLLCSQMETQNMKNALHRKFSVLAVILLLGVLGESAASPIGRQGEIAGPQRGALVLAGGGRTLQARRKRFVALSG